MRPAGPRRACCTAPSIVRGGATSAAAAGRPKTCSTVAEASTRVPSSASTLSVRSRGGRPIGPSRKARRPLVRRQHAHGVPVGEHAQPRRARRSDALDDSRVGLVGERRGERERDHTGKGRVTGIARYRPPSRRHLGMWAVIIIIAIIVVLGLFLVGIYNGMVRGAQPRRRGLERDRRPAQAPARPDPEPGRDASRAMRRTRRRSSRPSRRRARTR